MIALNKLILQHDQMPGVQPGRKTAGAVACALPMMDDSCRGIDVRLVEELLCFSTDVANFGRWDGQRHLRGIDEEPQVLNEFV